MEEDDPDRPVSYFGPLSRHEAVLVHSENRARSAIGRHPDFPGEEPPANAVLFFARPMLPELTIHATDGQGQQREILTRVPDDATIVVRFPRAGGVEDIGYARFLERRVRRVMACFAGEEFPIFAISICRLGQTEWSRPREDLQASSLRLSDVFHKVTSVVDQTRTLLDLFPLDHRLARAVDSLGASILSDDPEARFLHAWGALELMARNEFERAHPGTAQPKDEVKPIRDFLEETRRPLGLNTLKRWQGLRAGAAHGGRTRADYQEMWESDELINVTAREALHGALRNPSGPPMSAGKFASRVMVESWPSGRVLPVTHEQLKREDSARRQRKQRSSSSSRDR